MIIIPIIIGILLIIWLQYPQIKKDKADNKYTNESIIFYFFTNII